MKTFCSAELKKQVLPRLIRPRVGRSSFGFQGWAGGPDPVGAWPPAAALPLFVPPAEARACDDLELGCLLRPAFVGAAVGVGDSCCCCL